MLYPHPAKEAVPYNEIDPAMVKLCREINEFPGIVTTSSCQGYIDGHKLEVDEWDVSIESQSASGAMRYQTRGSIEFLVWLVNGCQTAEFDAHIDVFAPVPWLNGPGSCMTYVLSGYDTHPDQLAHVIKDYREKYFTRRQIAHAVHVCR